MVRVSKTLNTTSEKEGGYRLCWEKQMHLTTLLEAVEVEEEFEVEEVLEKLEADTEGEEKKSQEDEEFFSRIEYVAPEEALEVFEREYSSAEETEQEPYEEEYKEEQEEGGQIKFEWDTGVKYVKTGRDALMERTLNPISELEKALWVIEPDVALPAPGSPTQ